MALELAVTPIVRDVVLVEGSDARSYLQTQLTQDIESIGLGASTWSFILDPKGFIEALVRVTRIGHDRLTLDIEEGYGDRVRARLDGLLFRTDVKFTQATWPGLAWRGGTTQKTDAPIVADTPWPGVEGLDVIGPNVEVPPAAVTRSAAELEAIRIESGWPSMSAEIIDGVSPAMTGLVERTVSFDKGCYTGQEFVARVYHRGAAPPRRLVSLASHSPAAVGATLVVDGENVGVVTSMTDTGVGMGYLARKVETPADTTIGDLTVRATDLGGAV
jgi:folate-binding protein YgfZ